MSPRVSLPEQKSTWTPVLGVGVVTILIVVAAPGLELQERIDLAVALGTALLAVATVWLGQAARRDSLESLQAARRPVLDIRYDQTGGNFVGFTVENVGKGPALNVSTRVFLVSDTEAVEPNGVVEVFPMSGLANTLGTRATGTFTAITPPTRDHGLEGDKWPRVVVLAEYEDIAGDLCHTRADLKPGGGTSSVGTGGIAPEPQLAASQYRVQLQTVFMSAPGVYPFVGPANNTTPADLRGARFWRYRA